jgi:hypothetical protein
VVARAADGRGTGRSLLAEEMVPCSSPRSTCSTENAVANAHLSRLGD